MAIPMLVHGRRSGHLQGTPGEAQEMVSEQGEDGGGASKNRTYDLSIISAAL